MDVDILEPEIRTYHVHIQVIVQDMGLLIGD